MPKPTNKSGRILSAIAKAEIEERVEWSHPALLAEISKLVQNRGGAISPPQLEAVANLVELAYGSAATLSRWLADAGAAPSTGAVRTAITSAAGRRMTTAELRHLFDVDDEEAERLQLTRLVTERRRSLLRRRQEGVAARVGASAASPPPWEVAGVSRSAWYRAAKSSPAAAVKDAVRAVDGTRQPDREPWKALGISRATYYRGRSVNDRETAGGIPGDQTAPKHWFNYRYQVARNPTGSLTAQAPKIADLPTAAARRLATIALRLGFTWEIGTHDPATWFNPPKGRTLTPAEAHEYEVAVLLADRARVRAAAVASARGKAYDLANPEEARAPLPKANPDPQARPLRVSEDVWNAVPPELRPRVRRLAGRLFLQGYKPDEAIAEAIEPAARQLVLEAALADAAPDLPRDELRWYCNDWWRLPTAEGLASALAAWRAAQQKAEAELLVVPNAVRAAIERQSPPIPDEHRQAVLEAALKRLETWAHGTPDQVVPEAWAHLSRQL